jgi:inner membrane protein
MCGSLQGHSRSDIIVPRAKLMFVFGHMGLTLAGALALDVVLPKRHCTADAKAVQRMALPRAADSVKDLAVAASARLRSLAERMDLRILFLGSMVSDIIDKPIGRVIFRETYDNGRIYAHTLLFLMVVAAVGSYMYRRRGNSAGLVFSFGVLTHLFLDAMWFRPRTLFWPLLGLSFGEYPTDLYSWSGIQAVMEKVVANPAMALMALPELMGGLVLVWLAWHLVKSRHVYAFLRWGRV